MSPLADGAANLSEADAASGGSRRVSSADGSLADADVSSLAPLASGIACLSQAALPPDASSGPHTAHPSDGGHGAAAAIRPSSQRTQRRASDEGGTAGAVDPSGAAATATQSGPSVLEADVVARLTQLLPGLQQQPRGANGGARLDEVGYSRQPGTAHVAQLTRARCAARVVGR
jgi:hypothetical protein